MVLPSSRACRTGSIHVYTMQSSPVRRGGRGRKGKGVRVGKGFILLLPLTVKGVKTVTDPLTGMEPKKMKPL